MMTITAIAIYLLGVRMQYHLGGIIFSLDGEAPNFTKTVKIAAAFCWPVWAISSVKKGG